MRGSTDIVNALILLGAALDIEDEDGKSALMVASTGSGRMHQVGNLELAESRHRDRGRTEGSRRHTVKC